MDVQAGCRLWIVDVKGADRLHPATEWRKVARAHGPRRAAREAAFLAGHDGAGGWAEPRPKGAVSATRNFTIDGLEYVLCDAIA